MNIHIALLKLCCPSFHLLNEKNISKNTHKPVEIMTKRPANHESRQYIDEKSDKDKIVKNSPHGTTRSQYGWGTPFAPCKSAIVPGYGNIRIGVSSLNGVPGKHREMSTLITQYCKKFGALEHCNPYHRMGDETNWQHWHDYVHRAYPNFVYTIKANQFLTHSKMLEMDDDLASHIQTFFGDRCPVLKEHLGPVLIQLPPQFRMSKDHLDRIVAVAAKMPSGTRIAVEFRHRSWFCEEVYAVLRTIKWALVFTHNDDIGESPVVDTGASFFYARVHGICGKYMGDYGPEELTRFASIVKRFITKDDGEIDRSKEVFFFFNNNDTHIGGLTSSIVDSTCLAAKLTKLIKEGVTPTASATSVATPAAVPPSSPPKPTATTTATHAAVKEEIIELD